MISLPDKNVAVEDIRSNMSLGLAIIPISAFIQFTFNDLCAASVPECIFVGKDVDENFFLKMVKLLDCNANNMSHLLLPLPG